MQFYPHKRISFFVALLLGVAGHAQTITTFAGSGIAGYNGDENTPLATQLWSPAGVAVSGGNVYVADGLNNRLRRITQNGKVTTLAGNDDPGNVGDGGPATDAQLNDPEGVALDNQGNIFIADKYNNCIRKISAKGIISIYAGNGESGYSGDKGPATMAQLNAPNNITADRSGNIYIVDGGNNCIRKVTADGKITTVAGVGKEGFGHDGGSASAAALNSPRSVAVDSAGNVYIADALNYRIRKVNTAGIISTIAGNDTSGFGGDEDTATKAKLNMPTGVAVDNSGIYIADQGNNRIRKITPDGIMNTVAGGGADTTHQLSAPLYVAADGNGILYVTEQQNNKVKRVVPAPAGPKVVKNANKNTGTTTGKAYTPPPFATPGMNTPPPSYKSGYAPPPSGPSPVKRGR